jgi:pyridoxine 5-phosphate synthase
MIKLGVNIDHVATLRQARYADMIDSPNCEPDILAAASACERAGASGITVHLRADRRHIQDRDVFRLRDSIMTKLNLEMGNTPEIVETALRVLPDEVCLVPENRQEITTEGGDPAFQCAQTDDSTTSYRRNPHQHVYRTRRHSDSSVERNGSGRGGVAYRRIRQPAGFITTG